MSLFINLPYIKSPADTFSFYLKAPVTTKTLRRFSQTHFFLLQPPCLFTSGHFLVWPFMVANVIRSDWWYNTCIPNYLLALCVAGNLLLFSFNLTCFTVILYSLWFVLVILTWLDNFVFWKWRLIKAINCNCWCDQLFNFLNKCTC